MAHNPWIGDRQPLAWGAMLGLLLEDRWTSQAELREAGASGDLAQKTVDNLLDRGRLYGVLVRRGDYNGRLKRDFREYRLTPATWMNDVQSAWVCCPVDFKCPCGEWAAARAQVPSGLWQWVCSVHLARVRGA